MTTAERAAQLSARIHRAMRKAAVTTIDFWHEVVYRNLPDERERGYFWAGHCGELPAQWTTLGDDPFYRLGAELRAIALGNRKP